MIEVKAIADPTKGGCNVSITMEGNGHAILEESLAIIQGVMGSLKSEDMALHMLACRALADDPRILFGEDEEDMFVSRKDVQRIKIREGVN